jgi:fermentation-respiration switch protein FrsA (DUF1100 family)
MRWPPSLRTLRRGLLVLVPLALFLLIHPWLRPLRFLALASARQDAVGRWAHWSADTLKPSRPLSVPTAQGAIPIEVFEPAGGGGGTILLSSGVHSAGIQEPRLSPSLAVPPAAPVFFLHGALDAVVPASEPCALAAAWQGRARVRLLVTPLIGHAEAEAHGCLRDMIHLLSFWKEIMAA